MHVAQCTGRTKCARLRLPEGGRRGAKERRAASGGLPKQPTLRLLLRLPERSRGASECALLLRGAKAACAAKARRAAERGAKARPWRSCTAKDQ